MRIQFLHLGHANRCLKDCDIVLSQTLEKSSKKKLPITVVKNTLCRSLGYSSLIELTGHYRNESRRPLEPSSASDLLFRLIDGFDAVELILAENGIELPKDSSSVDMAGKVLFMLEGTKPSVDMKKRDSIHHDHELHYVAIGLRDKAEQGDFSPDERVALFNEAIDFASKNNLLDVVDESSYYAGQVLMAHFRPEEAHTYFAKCIALRDKQRIGWLTRANYASSALAIGDFTLARRLLEFDAILKSGDDQLIDCESALTDRHEWSLKEQARVKAYPECSGHAHTAWIRVLERILAGDNEKAARALAWARFKNPRVELYLLGEVSTPSPYYEFRDGDVSLLRSTKAEREDAEARYCYAIAAPSWSHYPKALEWLKKAPHTKLPPKARYKEYVTPRPITFYRTTIEGREFGATLHGGSGGIIVYDYKNRDSANLGVCEIVHDEANKIYRHVCSNTKHYFVAKYGDSWQAKIDLCELSEKGLKEFAKSFGIPICFARNYSGREDGFYKSPAFTALCEWAKNNPKKNRRYRGAQYLYNVTEEIERRLRPHDRELRENERVVH
jgi:hypothetical protein